MSLIKSIQTGALALACLACAARGVETEPERPLELAANDRDFVDLSIEELMSIKITSVSKKEEKVSETASAISVITQEDIRRSGVTSIADALRMAPGMNVAQVNAHAWAISARGFQGMLANKLLVLVDGRTVYSPLYSGVYWDVQDTMLEDIERIEVIRGPGATVWGANAVNGVINIITKKSTDTQGLLASGSAGTRDTGIGSIRYGGKIGEKTTYRAFLKYAKRDEGSVVPTGLAGHDGWDKAQGGARFDFRPTKEDTVILEGEYYKGMFEEKPSIATLRPASMIRPTNDATMAGGNVLTRWEHSFSDTSNTSLQLYYDHTEREEVKLNQAIDTIDVDFSHQLKAGRHDIVYGAGYRHVKQSLNTTFSVQFMPAGRQTDLFSAFVQDEITVLKDKLSITVGSKFEHNDFTGFEVQPSIKALWRPLKNHAVWASVSRSVRTPAPTETDLRANLIAVPPFFLASLFPNREIPSERVFSYEFGYRAQLHKRFSIDAAGFFNAYHGLRSNELGAPFLERTPLPIHFTLPVTQQAAVRGETYGGEVSAVWAPIDRIRLTAGYSFLKTLLHQDSNSHANDAEVAEGQSPEHQFHTRMFVDLPNNLEFDTAVYFVDGLKTLEIPSYTRLDARLGWRPTRHFDISIGGQNLLRERHQEYAPEQNWVERNVYVKFTLKF